MAIIVTIAIVSIFVMVVILIIAITSTKSTIYKRLDIGCITVVLYYD